jgi:outer membrane protein, multidrug efflux system
MLKTRLSTSATVLSCLCVFAAGCLPSLAGNEPREPNKAMPASFGGPASAADAPAKQGSSAQKRWRDFFDSPELRALIETGLEKNQELNIQFQEILITLNEKSARQANSSPSSAPASAPASKRWARKPARASATRPTA